MSTPLMVSGYTNLSVTDLATTSAAQGDGTNGYSYYSVLLWHLTRALVACGMVCTGSSSRTSGFGLDANGSPSATDLWAAGSYAAAYNNAWFGGRLTIGGIQRNFSFQAGGGSNNGGVRAKMSIGAGNEFTDSGGGVTAIRTKAITGEGMLTPDPVFGGTDASPSFSSMPVTGGSFYVNACWDAATGYFAFEAHPAAGGTGASAGLVFAILPLDPGSVLSTRDTHVVLFSTGTLLTVSAITETSLTPRAIYQCRKGVGSGTAIAAMKPQHRVALGATATDPGTGDKINSLVSWKRDIAPVDTGGLTPDMIALGEVISVPNMLDIKVDPNVPAVLRRYLCLGELALRFPNSLVSN